MPLQTRITSIDLLRGMVMIIMALDHTRDFFHSQAFTGDPLDLTTTTPLLFFTRWITHFCAPVFVFLSGTSAYLQSLRKSKTLLSSFLLSRGLWLILVDLFIMTLGISFNIAYSVFILQVIWAIGISMVVLSFLIRLPFAVILAIGVLIIAGHNILDYYEASHKGDYSPWYTLIHRQGLVKLTSEHSVLIFYPFLPWTGVMILGYCFGKFYLHNVFNRNKRSIFLGLTLIALFIILRLIDMYGDPLHWSKQKTFFYSLLSFINTQKYPPSLLFFCMTIGPALVVLGLIGDAKNKLSDIITVFGRVPLFYYILHFYILHFLSAIFYLSRGHTFDEGMKSTQPFPFKFVAEGEGYGLAIVYLVWILVVIFLYPLCKWYSTYKLESRKWWLSYL